MPSYNHRIESHAYLTQIEVIVEFSYTPEIAPVTSAPPELCLEAQEEDLTITRVLHGNTDIRNLLSPAELERLEKVCWDWVENQKEPDTDAPESDPRYPW